jgi:hypothetical protein
LDAVSKPFATKEALERYRRLNEVSPDPHAADAHGEDVVHEEHAHDTTSQDTVLYLMLCAAVGQALKMFSGYSGIPYTSMITVVGLLCGIYSPYLGRIGKAID